MVLGQDRSELGLKLDLDIRHLLSRFIVHQSSVWRVWRYQSGNRNP